MPAFKSRSPHSRIISSKLRRKVHEYLQSFRRFFSLFLRHEKGTDALERSFLLALSGYFSLGAHIHLDPFARAQCAEFTPDFDDRAYLLAGELERLHRYFD